MVKSWCWQKSDTISPTCSSFIRGFSVSRNWGTGTQLDPFKKFQTRSWLQLNAGVLKSEGKPSGERARLELKLHRSIRNISNAS